MKNMIYCGKKREKRLGITLAAFPNAGPRPSIRGMRKLCWGKDALIVRQGEYIYKVDERTFGRIWPGGVE